MSGIRGVTGLRPAMGTILQASAEVWRKTRTPDASGGQTDTYAKVHTYPCKFEPAALIPREREQRGILIQSQDYWTFRFAYDVDIQNTDRLKVNGRTFEVSGGGTDTLRIFALFTCEEIK